MAGMTIGNLCAGLDITPGALNSWITRGLLDLGENPGKGRARTFTKFQGLQIAALVELGHLGIPINDAAILVKAISEGDSGKFNHPIIISSDLLCLDRIGKNLHFIHYTADDNLIERLTLNGVIRDLRAVDTDLNNMRIPQSFVFVHLKLIRRNVRSMWAAFEIEDDQNEADWPDWVD